MEHNTVVAITVLSVLIFGNLLVWIPYIILLISFKNLKNKKNYYEKPHSRRN